jgi:transcriptional regulator with XRE-family HTH domain
MDALRADLREARVAAGLSLRTVGEQIGLSTSQAARIEGSTTTPPILNHLARFGSVVGLDVRIRAYRGPDPVRDAPKRRLIDRLRHRLAVNLRVRTEVPLPDGQRAWDARIEGLDRVGGGFAHVVVEAESRLADIQAQTRRLHLKLRDSDEDLLILLVADTRYNRAAVAAARSTIDELFPVSPREALADLAAGRRPRGSALTFI